MASATEHLLAEVWAQGGVRDVYADFNELTLNITTNALFGVDMSSSQAAGISGKHSQGKPPLPPPPPPTHFPLPCVKGALHSDCMSHA